ncbi:MAG: hypothetical protein ACK44Y_01370, partial [Novosphingobium sp.]
MSELVHLETFRAERCVTLDLTQLTLCPLLPTAWKPQKSKVGEPFSGVTLPTAEKMPINLAIAQGMAGFGRVGN